MAYINLSWELYLNKGYQTFGPISSVVTTKVKGYGYGSSKDQNDHQLEHDFSQSLNILDTTGKNYNKIMIIDYNLINSILMKTMLYHH